MKGEKKYFLTFSLYLFLLSPGIARNNQEKEFILYNPFDFPVCGQPVVLQVKSAAEKTSNFPLKEKVSLPVQIDVFSSEETEIVGLVDLNPKERKRVKLLPVKNEFSPGPTLAEMEKGKKYFFSNEIFSCLFYLGEPDKEGLVKGRLTEFRYRNGQKTGVSSIEGFHLGFFQGKPDIRIISGPFRTTLLITGKSQLRYQNVEIIPGTTKSKISIYRQSPMIDLETLFVPEQNGSLYICGTGQLVVDTTTETWLVHSLDVKTRKPVSVVFGIPAKSQQNTGCCWSAVAGKVSAFSYVCDDLKSSFGAKKGEAGAYRSGLQWWIWNFNEKSNYINPHQFGTEYTAGKPVSLRMRLTLYPQLPEDVSFGEKDYLKFQTDFLAPHYVKEREVFSGRVAITATDRNKISKLLQEMDIAILSGDKMSKSSLYCAEKLAKAFQSPLLTAKNFSNFLNTQYPTYQCENLLLILVGTPEENTVVGANNPGYGFVDCYYPGPEKGRIVLIPDFLKTGLPVIYAGGQDISGVKLATEYLIQHFHLKPITCPQVRLLSPEMRVRPWMRRSKPEKVHITACQGQVEPVHLLLFFPEKQKIIRVQVTLKNANNSRIESEISHIYWTFPLLDSDGTVYPAARSIYLIGHPLPHRAPTYPLNIPEEKRPVYVCPEPNNDALWPGIPDQVPAESYLSLWFNFLIPDSAVPGLYQGKIQIDCADSSFQIPVEMNVLPVVLPSGWVMDLNLMYGLYSYRENSLALYLNLKPDEPCYEKALFQLGKLFSSHGVTVATVAGSGWGLYGLECFLKEKGMPCWDLTGMEKVISAYQKAGFSGRFEIVGHPNNLLPVARTMMKKLNLTEEEAFNLLADSLAASLKNKDYRDRLYVRVGDEPADMDAWVKAASFFRRAGLPVTVCHNRTSRKEIEKMIGTINIWCPNWIFLVTRYGRTMSEEEPTIFSQKFLQERKKEGEVVWNYTCKGGAPYADLRTTPTQIRFFLWDSFLKGCDGAVYYGGGYWSHMWSGGELGGKGVVELRDHFVFDVYANTDYPGGWPGGTTVFYPDASEKRIIGSQRLELFRQAQEDIKLLFLVKERLGQEKLKEMVAPVLAPEGERQSFYNITPERFQTVKTALRKALMESITH